MNIGTYRKKPVIIQAARLIEGRVQMICEWCGGRPQYDPHGKIDGIAIETLEGRMQADIGDFIIQDVKDEFYPCKPDIFEMTYEAVLSTGGQ